jgi:hypothetical protein
VGGRPSSVSQRYLGPAEEIKARLSGASPGEPDRSRHEAIGDVAAVWAVLRRLEVAEIADDVVESRRADAAASVGGYISLAALNRVCHPAGSWHSSVGVPRRLVTAGCALPSPRSTTAAFRRPWITSTKPGSKRSRVASWPVYRVGQRRGVLAGTPRPATRRFQDECQSPKTCF